MEEIHLYRKRFIPNEIVELKDDLIVFQSKDIIITKWNTLKPRKDISYGISAYFIKAGYKVSKMFNSNGEVVYWYCDLINTVYNFDENQIIFEDLLIDVLVYENGTVRVIDFAEFAEALDTQLISSATASQALHSLDQLLSIIYSGNFNTLQAQINHFSN